MPDHYRSLAEKPFDSYYLWEQIDIDAPASTVFEYARRISGWMDAHVLVTVDGTPGEVGHFERAYIQNLAPGTPEPHHHVYGIAHMIPNRYIALEVVQERGGSYGEEREWTMFDGIFLIDLDPERTRVVFNMIDIYDGKGSPESDAEHREAVENGRARIASYLGTLKAQAEGRAA